MSDQNHNQQMAEPKGRPVGCTEHSWSQAVSCGTGITVLALQLSKEPDTLNLQNALHKLQNTHPLLQSKLHKNTTTNTLSFVTPPNSNLKIKTFNLSTASNVLQSLSNPCNHSVSPLHTILERELNDNAWSDPSRLSCTGTDVFFASVYTLPGTKWVVVLRLHTAASDRTTAVSLLKELMGLVGDRERQGGGTQKAIGDKGEVSVGIEDLIPCGKAKKPLWAHGVDMLGYSVNSLRLTNLKFKDVKWPRCSEVVRLHMNTKDTEMILAGCKSRGIKLCGALAAAGLIAAHSAKRRPDLHRKKYGVITLIDCRSLLDPPLSGHHFGFYHSAILNIHEVKGGENLWELARRSYMAIENSKKSNKHFSDMADLNFLMCKAIDNPSLTSSSSLRTSLMVVFEDPVIEESSKMERELGVEDYMGCASVHGVGPSIGIFDTIRDGELDCVCVYPSPLHSREQMQELVENMKMILIDAASN